MKPGSKAWVERVHQLEQEEANEPLKWFYCSFATEHKFLGGVFVQAHGVLDAATRTHWMGINPGGEMAALEIPDVARLPKVKYRNVLLSKEALVLAIGRLCTLGGKDVQ